MAKSTPELNQFVKDFLAACAARDGEFVTKHSVEDDEAGYTGIHTGTEPVDWSVASTVAQLAPLAPAKLANSNPQGWVVGDVAWFTDFPHGVLPNGQVLPDPVRVTVVARKIEGEWKIAQWHISEAVARDLDPNAPEQN